MKSAVRLQMISEGLEAIIILADRTYENANGPLPTGCHSPVGELAQHCRQQLMEHIEESKNSLNNL